MKDKFALGFIAIILLILGLLVAGDLHGATIIGDAKIQGNVYFNADSLDSVVIWIVCRNAANDSIVEIDTIGTFRFLCPYVIDSVHTADSIKTRKLYAVTSGHRAIKAIAQDSVAILGSASSGRIGVAGEAQHIGVYAITLQDTSLLAKTAMSYGGVITSLDSFGLKVSSAKYGLVVLAGESESPPVVLNNSYAIQATAEDSFAAYLKAGWIPLYVEACSTGAIAGLFVGPVQINDSTADSISLSVSSEYTSSANKRSIVGNVYCKNTTSNDIAGVWGYANTKSGGTVKGVEGTAQAYDTSTTSSTALYGGDFCAQGNGGGVHIGVQASASGDDQICYGAYIQSSSTSGAELGIYCDADSNYYNGVIAAQKYYGDGSGLTDIPGEDTTFVWSRMIQWSGGGASISTTNCNYWTNGANDDLYGLFDLPHEILGDSVSIDSMFLNYKINELDDSCMIYLRYVHDGNMNNKIDSTATWQGGAGGSQAWGPSDNILSNGSYHVPSDYGFIVWIDMVNDDNANYFEYWIRIYAHKF